MGPDAESEGNSFPEAPAFTCGPPGGVQAPPPQRGHDASNLRRPPRAFVEPGLIPARRFLSSVVHLSSVYAGLDDRTRHRLPGSVGDDAHRPAALRFRIHLYHHGRLFVVDLRAVHFLGGPAASQHHGDDVFALFQH